MAGENDRHAIFLLLAFIILISAYKLRFELLHFYVGHRLSMAALLSVAIVSVGRSFGNIYLAWQDRKMRGLALLRARPSDDAVHAGYTPDGMRVDIQHSYRTMHAQVVGTTNAGKTESVIVPWAVDDIKRGRGFVMIDGKSDRALLDKIWAYAVKHGREHDFRVLSISDVSISNTFNPFAGGSPLEITERFFKAFEFENEFFKDIQYEALLFTLLLFDNSKTPATPIRIIDFLKNPGNAQDLIASVSDAQLLAWVTGFSKLGRDERDQRTMGLVTKLQAFSVGTLKPIFNVEVPEIDLEEALQKNLIVYCQLPVLKVPVLGKSVGKLVLQALQGAIASRHLSVDKKQCYFSVYLDDFTEYLTEGFVSTLNKSRSAKVLVTFAHQAIGDLAVLGDSIQNTILTNANLKVFMRTNEPTSAEYFASVVGTNQTEKITERQSSSALGAAKTGEGSVRDAEEFIFHPNVFKQELGTGEAVIVVPHVRGSTSARVKFQMLPDIDSPPLRKVARSDVPVQEARKEGRQPAVRSYTNQFYRKEKQA